VPTGVSSSATPTIALLPRERAARAMLGRGLAACVVVAVVVPAMALVSVALEAPTAPAAPPVLAPAVASAPSVDVTPIERDIAALQEAWRSERLRAVHAERGDRLRVLGRLIAKARDARRAAGQAGADLRGPFPLAELGDVDVLGLGPDRWLLGRDGVVFAPAGMVAPAALATTGRDEEPLELAANNVTLVRRCVPNEGYCLVDVDRVAPAAPAVDLSSLRAARAATATAPAAASSSTTPSPAPSRWPLVVAALVAVVVGGFAASRLLALSAQLRQLAFRLRHRQRRRSDVDLSAEELNDLDRAIDDALSGLDDELAAVQLQERRRERLQAIAATLDDAATRGGVPRIATLDDDDDDTALAALAFSVNALLDALDARALRFKVALADLDDVTQIVPAMAQRLLRLARHPELPTAAVEELTNLGNAVGQRVRRLNTLPVLVDEVARLTPASSDVMTRAEAVAPFAPDDALRLAVADQKPQHTADDDVTESASSTGTIAP
jgi:hypothetical protein